LESKLCQNWMLKKNNDFYLHNVSLGIKHCIAINLDNHNHGRAIHVPTIK
ncbi:13686_t:CDS:1, partial [Funneliformis mosseae]